MLRTTLGIRLTLDTIVLRCAFDTKLVIILTMPTFAFFTIQPIGMATLLGAFPAALVAFAARLADALLAEPIGVVMGWLTDLADLFISMAFDGEAGLCSFITSFLACAGGCYTVGTAAKRGDENCFWRKLARVSNNYIP